MATKRIVYVVQVPINEEQGGADYGWEGLQILLRQGHWASGEVTIITDEEDVVLRATQAFPTLTYGTANDPWAAPAATQLYGSGREGPYTFAVTAGTFPPGLSLSASGAVTGTPTEAGVFAPTITITSALGPTADVVWDIEILV